MCGIVGIYSTKPSGATNALAQAFRDLLVLDSLRGFDSTGMFYEDGKGETKYIKKAITGAEFVRDNVSRNSMRGYRYAIGHNRAATIGKVTDELAHPFVYENVCGVHNGTISSWRWLFDDADQSVESDTAKLYSQLDKTDADVKSVIGVLDEAEAGAYALVWRDRRVNELRIARNTDRPLSIAETEDGLVFASEAEFVDFAVARAGLKRVADTFSLKTYTLLCIPLDGESEAYTTEYTPTPKSLGYPTSTSPYLGGHSSGGYYNDYYYQSSQSRARRGMKHYDIYSSWTFTSMPTTLGHDITKAIIKLFKLEIPGMAEEWEKRTSPTDFNGTNISLKDELPWRINVMSSAYTYYNDHCPDAFGTQTLCAYIEDYNPATRSYLGWVCVGDGNVLPIVIDGTSNMGELSDVYSTLKDNKIAVVAVDLMSVRAYSCVRLGLVGVPTTVKLLDSDDWVDVQETHPDLNSTGEWNDWLVFTEQESDSRQLALVQ